MAFGSGASMSDFGISQYTRNKSVAAMRLFVGGVVSKTSGSYRSRGIRPRLIMVVGAMRLLRGYAANFETPS